MLILFMFNVFLTGAFAADDVTPLPNIGDALQRRDRKLYEICQNILDDMERETVGLAPGQVFLHDGRPVLITDGAFRRNGRVSNFWDWLPIEDEGFGPAEHGYDNEGKFRPVPAGLELTLDLAALTPTLERERQIPGVFRTPNGQLALVVAAGSANVSWLAIDDGGRVARGELRHSPVSRRQVLSDWTAYRSHRWSIHLPAPPR